MYGQNFEAAKAYQKMGWSVIPVHGKKPAVRWKLYQDILPDDDDIKEWFGQDGKFKDGNIGLVTGAISNTILVDFDSLDALLAFKEHSDDESITCPQVHTGGHGHRVHAFFKYPTEILELSGKKRIASFVGKLSGFDSRFAGLDLRGDGGYAVLPPSIHPDTGKPYRWAVKPNDCGNSDLPGWFLELILADGNNTRKSENQSTKDGHEPFGNDYAELWRGVGKGRRNDTCARLAGHYLAKGLSIREIESMILRWNERNDPPMAEKEVVATVRSIYAKDEKRAGFEIGGIQFTDGWNAKRFITEFGENVRYIDDWGKWLIWNSAEGRYLVDRKLWAVRLAKETVKKMLRDAANIEDDRDRKALVRHASRSDSSSKYRAMVDLARSEPGIPIGADELDKDPMLLNVLNGTIDLSTGKIASHNRRNLITKLAPVLYDPFAVCPFWLHSLKTYTKGNQGLIDFLQKAIGYSLTGEIREQVLLILYGGGANGKSTLIETILGLMGDYAQQSEPDLLIKKRHDGHPTGIADLMGTRYVATTEIGEGVRLDESLVKRLTGGDSLKARFMRQDFFDFKPTHKLWIGVNHKPIIRGTDAGIWRRIRLIPFDVNLEKTLSPDQLMPFSVVLAKLREEWPGILNWAVEGCLRWQKEGLGMPPEIEAATNEYREEMDVTGRFIDECCIIDENVKAKAKDLYQSYKEWCEENGEYATSQKMFGGKLRDKNFEKRRGHGGSIWWFGVGIADNNGGTVNDHTHSKDAPGGSDTMGGEDYELF